MIASTVMPRKILQSLTGQVLVLLMLLWTVRSSRSPFHSWLHLQKVLSRPLRKHGPKSLADNHCGQGLGRRHKHAGVTLWSRPGRVPRPCSPKLLSQRRRSLCNHCLVSPKQLDLPGKRSRLPLSLPLRPHQASQPSLIKLWAVLLSERRKELPRPQQRTRQGLKLQRRPLLRLLDSQ